MTFPDGSGDRIVDIHMTKDRESQGGGDGNAHPAQGCHRGKEEPDGAEGRQLQAQSVSSITRHDILNQLVVIHGYGELIMTKRQGDEELTRIMDKIIASASAIQHGIEFSKEYQNSGC